MDRTFRKIRKNDTPFGGVTMVFSGDWRQCKYLVTITQTSDCNMHFIPIFLQAYQYFKKQAELRLLNKLLSILTYGIKSRASN